jgi:ssDNA-binding replication factor A large subunit
MRNIELVGKILKKFDVREFKTANREGKVGSFVIGDETGTIRITCWNDQTDKMLPLQENDVVKLEDGYVRENRGALEIHLNEKSTIAQNPEGVTVEAVQQAPTLAQTESKRKTIKELQENDNNIEILGTIVQVFTMNFYERCPQCRKRVREPDFQCGEHGIVEPQYAYVMNCYLDDGSANIRTVFFSDQIQQLTKKTDEDIQTYRTAPENFEQVKTDLLGEMVKVVGRTTKNQMFDRIEFVVNHVDRDVNPEEEIARLQKELETKA